MRKEDNNEEMTFLDHLEELRWHIVRSIIAVIIIGIAAFVYKKIVFDIIVLGPSNPNFFTNRVFCQAGAKFSEWFSWINPEVLCINSKPIKLQSIEMAGQFLAHIKISLIGGLVIAFPYIFLEFWRFIRPALYSQEKRYARGAVFFITLLFFLGVLFGYFIICPLSVNFLYNYQVTELAQNNIKLMSYVSTIASISLASGILFELPVVVLFLSKIGLITPEFLKHYRKHALVLILIISAIITPPDVFSQILVSLPLLVLYEFSIKISRRITAKVQLGDNTTSEN